MDKDCQKLPLNEKLIIWFSSKCLKSFNDEVLDRAL